MDSYKELNSEKGDKLITNNNKNYLKKIKSVFFLEKLLFSLSKKKLLNIIKYNKQTQNILDININNYKKYCEIYSPIEIEIIPAKERYGTFVNVIHGFESFYHIYFNDSKEEVQKYYFTENDKLEKIKIIIDHEVVTFFSLFQDCSCIQSIYFRKFYRKNISNMSRMFWNCSSLKEINLSNFNTNNVNDMSGMFGGCLSLKEINLSNFNTNNVNIMSGMFYRCLSLKEINLSNFNTNNVIIMAQMFEGCTSLKEINLSNFNTNNVNDMRGMFNGCLSLKEINLSIIYLISILIMLMI